MELRKGLLLLLLVREPASNSLIGKSWQEGTRGVNSPQSSLCGRRTNNQDKIYFDKEACPFCLLTCISALSYFKNDYFICKVMKE